MHSTQPRMASLDSWDRTRSQTWRSAVPRWAAPVERLLLRNCATEPARLLLRSLIIRDRSKMKTAGMLPDCAAQKKRKALKRRRKGVVWLREGMKSPAILALALSLSLCQERQSEEGAVKPGSQNFPSEPEQKICPDKKLGVMESEGQTSSITAYHLWSNVLNSQTPTLPLPYLHLEVQRNRFSPEPFKKKKKNPGQNLSRENKLQRLMWALSVQQWECFLQRWASSFSVSEEQLSRRFLLNGTEQPCHFSP